MDHLDAAALAALEANDPAATAHFRDHLARRCETCEAFLAQAHGPAPLDGYADQVLLSSSGVHEERPNELELFQIRRALGGRFPAPRKEPRRWVPAAAALAAGLVLVLFLGRHLSRPDERPQLGAGGWDGVKATGKQLSLELSAVARAPAGQLRRLDRGAQADAREVLLLRYHATEAGSGLLFQQVRGAAPELLGQFALEPGTHDLGGEGGLTGVSLGGTSGQLTLWLVGFPAGDAPDPERARRVLVQNADAEELGLAAARFDLSVREGAR